MALRLVHHTEPRLTTVRPRACLQGVQDPNARNCHGYRKFVKRTVLENPSYGYLVNDTIVIRYTIELVISSGGALSRTPGAAAIPRPPAIQVLLLCPEDCHERHQ